MKIAHILKNFEPGGVEKWLLDITKLNNQLGNKLKLEFLLQSSSNGYFSSEIISNNGSIHNIVYSRYNFIFYLIKLFVFFKKNKYDVVHSHVYHFSGFILLIAYLAGVPNRISHCHNEKKDRKNSLLKKIYINVCEKLISTFATKKIAVSKNSAKLFYKNPENAIIMPCGILFEEKKGPTFRNFTNDIHLLSVASFTYQKNHDFMLEIANQLNIQNIKFIFTWIGSGEVSSSLNDKIKKYNLQDKIIILGKRNDVHDIMINSSDILIFPSYYEGLGLAAVESQYYGLPTLINESLPEELNVSNYIFRLPINDGDASQWANIIKKNIKPTVEEIKETRRKINTSSFNVINNFNKLTSIYTK
ncbi:TPA: glycosyltransferase [Providencia rettgeri]